MCPALPVSDMVPRDWQGQSEQQIVNVDIQPAFFSGMDLTAVSVWCPCVFSFLLRMSHDIHTTISLRCTKQTYQI